MRIQLDVVLVARKHLAKAAELHLPRSEVTDQGFLERRTETRHFRSACPVRTVGAALEAVTAQEIRMLRFHIPEPRHIDRVGPTSYPPPVHRECHRTSRSAIHDVVHQIVPQLAAGAAESIREFRRRRVEKDARRFHRRRIEKDNLCIDVEHLLGVRVDHSHTGRAAFGWIIDHAMHDAERSQSQAPRFARGGERRVDAAEIRERDASARTVSAEVTLLAPTVVLCKHGQARVGDYALATEFREQNVPRLLFGRIQWPRCLELPVGHLWKIFPTPLNSDELLDVAPPRSEILVANRPVYAIALLRIGLEVEIAPAVDAPPPHDRAASNLPSAYPVKPLVIGKRVRV